MVTSIIIYANSSNMACMAKQIKNIKFVSEVENYLCLHKEYSKNHIMEKCGQRSRFLEDVFNDLPSPVVGILTHPTTAATSATLEQTLPTDRGHPPVNLPTLPIKSYSTALRTKNIVLVLRTNDTSGIKVILKQKYIIFSQFDPHTTTLPTLKRVLSSELQCREVHGILKSIRYITVLLLYRNM